MDDKSKSYSLLQRWEWDVQMYKEGARVKIASPQCETCSNWIKGDAYHCKHYKNEIKPKSVVSIKKECAYYCNENQLKILISMEQENRIYGGLFGFSMKRLSENFIKFYENGVFTPHGEVFDIGKSTREAIEKMKDGKNPTECGGTAVSDNGNGSLMRILPLAFYGQGIKDEELIRLVEDISSLTHRHKCSKLACILYVKFAMQLVLGNNKKQALENTVKFIKKNCTKEYANEFKKYHRILNKEIAGLEEEQIRSTGYVVDTIEASLWAFFHGKNYEEVVLKAVNLGGDTDTIAGIAGGIGGIYYGYKNIPERWLQSLVKKEELYEIFEQYCCNLKHIAEEAEKQKGIKIKTNILSLLFHLKNRNKKDD